MGFETAIALGLFLAAWGLTSLFVPLAVRFGRRWEILDDPGERKVHETPTPRTGGVAIYLSLAVCVVASIALVPALQTSFFFQPVFYLALAGGVTIVFGVGLYDDVAAAPIWQRLGLETAAAVLVIVVGDLVVESLTVPFVGTVDLGVLSIPVTVLWIVGMTNALNIIDGLDGLAGGIAFIACFGVFAVALMNGDTMAMASLALLAGACLGFLRYNSHPAQVFLGDSGALMLGFLLACISIETSLKRSTGLALFIPMQMLAVPLLDTLYVMVRRVIDQFTSSDDFSMGDVLAMFRADQKHIHHILLEVGFSHPRAVWLLYGLSGGIAVFGLLTALSLNDRVSLLFLLLGVAGFLILRHYGESIPFIRRWREAERSSGPYYTVDPEEGSSGPYHTVESEDGAVEEERESSGPHATVG